MIRSEFQGDYGDLTLDGLYDREVAALIAQMGDNPAKPQPGVQAIAVFLANRYKVMSLGDLQFLWTPDSQECGGNDEAYNCVAIPGFFTAIVKHNDLRIPQEFAHFDDGRATYYLGFKPTANGQPGFGLLYVNPRARGVFREVALPLLAIGSLVYDWSGQLGYAILGAGNAAAATTLTLEIAMASGLTQLQVAQLVGSAAVGAVTSGGDVGKAVENVAASYLGAQAGNLVSTAVDSAAAAKITSAAVSAAATGQDVGRAILMTGAPLAAGAAAGAFTSGSTVDDYLFPGTSDNFGYDWSLAPGDVVIDPGSLGLTGDITVDEDALMREGLDAAALVPDDLGILYNVAGQWVEIPIEEYALQLYASRGPNGGVRVVGSDNNEVLSELQVANRTSDADLQTQLMQGLTARCGPTQSCGLTQPSGPSPADRPASLTQPAKETTVSGVLDYAKVAEALTKSFANIITVIRQVENGTYGRAPSPYGQTGPYGTLRPQQPGVPVRNADGSVTVNNGNGTQTTTKPNGQVVTTRTSVAGGTFGGISSNTLLIAGAGLAALLLLRRK